MAVLIFSANWPGQNNSEWDASTNGARGGFTWPVGRTGRSMQAGIEGGGPGQLAYVTDNFTALGTGDNWHGQHYIRVINEDTNGADIMVLSLENAASAEGVLVKLDTAPSGTDYRLWMGNNDGVGAYSSYAVPDDTWVKIDPYVHLSASAVVGKTALLIDDVEEVLDTTITTMPNGDLNRLRLGLDFLATTIGNASKFLDVRFDDFFHWSEDPYSAWVPSGVARPKVGSSLGGAPRIGGLT